uniref:Uncharacterized protein n=1 Tax=Rhizophora mucronata TaxID=61149 RepID=A0A2P2NKC8_RHIMU
MIEKKKKALKSDACKGAAFEVILAGRSRGSLQRLAIFNPFLRRATVLQPWRPFKMPLLFSSDKT